MNYWLTPVTQRAWIGIVLHAEYRQHFILIHGSLFIHSLTENVLYAIRTSVPGSSKLSVWVCARSIQEILCLDVLLSVTTNIVSQTTITTTTTWNEKKSTSSINYNAAVPKITSYQLQPKWQKTRFCNWIEIGGNWVNKSFLIDLNLATNDNYKNFLIQLRWDKKKSTTCEWSMTLASLIAKLIKFIVKIDNRQEIEIFLGG